jgi:radical SAM superfamily enzyme YgiQ (UPF0313 family)
LASAKKVIEEIRYLHEGFGFTALLFPEDIFVLDRRRTDEVAEEIKRRNIIWRFLARADLIVKYGQGFVDHLADCGCVEVGMGIESGSNTILKTIKKGETAEIMLKAIRMLQTSGIRVKGFIILGLPGESHQTVAETRAFLDDAKMADLDVKIYQPYPGSRIYTEREKFDIQWTETDLAHTFYKGRPGEYEGTVSTSSLTTEELVEEWTAMEAAYKRWKS